jgi:nitric oxide synthase-interacting protein
VDIERELKAWEAQQATDASEEAGKQQKDHDARIEEFVARQEGLSKTDLASRQPAGAAKGAVGAVMGRRLLDDKGAHAADTSFWVPQLTPQAKARLDKPDGVVRCPFTNEPLKLKQLYPVHFTPADEAASPSEILSMPRNERYICPLTKKALSNVNPCALLRPSGKVVSMAAVTSIIKKDMLDPFTEPPTKTKESDIIPFRVEGTGFAAKADEKALKVTKVSEAGRF